MNVVVRNVRHNIEVCYNNVKDVVTGFPNMFVLFFTNGEKATFHHVDDDGSEWDYHIK